MAQQTVTALCRRSYSSSTFRSTQAPQDNELLRAHSPPPFHLSQHTWSESEVMRRPRGLIFKTLINLQKKSSCGVVEPSWVSHCPPRATWVPLLFPPCFSCAYPPRLYLSPTLTTVHEHHHSRCRACSRFSVWSPSLPPRCAIASSGSTSVQISSTTSRGTHSGTFTVLGITSLCSFAFETL